MAEVNRRFIISLGGSLIVPDSIDTVFLENFRTAVFSLLDEGNAFLIIPGGGATARRYQKAASVLGVTDRETLDWVGIKASRGNAQLLHALLGEVVYPEVVMDNALVSRISAPVIIAAGGAPGRSSDAGSVELAQAAGVDTIINLSNVAHVYSRDPRLNPDAEAYREISWKDYRSLIPQEWDPGLSTPFDPVASKMAEVSGLTVAILDGHDIPSFEQFVRTGVCKGTIIRNGKA